MNTSVDSNSTLLSSFSEHLLSVQYVLFSAADSINLILGLPTNVYILWLIVTGAVGTMASDFFSLNLAVSEILSILSNLMFIIYRLLLENDVLRSVGTFFTGFNLFGRPLFQCCICVERYLAVVHPVTFLKYKPLRYRVGCCGVVWMMVLGFCFAKLLGKYQSAWWKIFTLILNLLTISVMLFCCLAVLWALKRPGPGEGERGGEGMNNMKLRAFRIISMIMVSMLVMYLPLVLLLVSYHFIESVELLGGWSICYSITVVSGFVQPLLFLHRSGKLPCVRGP
ncbi:C-C chemokine receptor type 8-like [Oncorhynchus nerka]|uniref:C-C chemokine receptor type 8-like n=1 Tax=Oncorhynchus nerka TaxID=8023 RepID=UPI0031B80265